MTVLPYLLASSALLVLAGCTPPVGVSSAVESVSSFRVSPTFNAFEEPCVIRYRLEISGEVQIRITAVGADGTRSLVRDITRPRRETAGQREAHWRGIGPNSLFAPQGEYVVELYVTPDAPGAVTESWELTTIMYRS
jgi:hypothetical protein